MTIEDVGFATAGLATDAAKLVTGDTIYIDGGTTSWAEPARCTGMEPDDRIEPLAALRVKGTGAPERSWEGRRRLSRREAWSG